MRFPQKNYRVQLGRCTLSSLPLNDSYAARFFFLVAFRVASSHSCRSVTGEYLLSGRSVGTHLELSQVSSSWNSPMGSIAPGLRFCHSIMVG